MKRRFFRRRSRRRGSKADVLNFSLCNYQNDLTASLDGPAFNCPNPGLYMTPLVLGGQAGFSGGSAAAGVQALFLTDKAERGGVVGGFKFKHFALVGNHINQAGTDTSEVFSDVIYNAIVKLEYDLDAYRATGVPLVSSIPNIVHTSVRYQGTGGNLASPLSDISADVLWRDISFGQSVASDNTDVSLVHTQDAANLQLWSFTNTVPWTVIKVKRRLKEDEGLFWVTNIVSGQPSFNPGVSEFTHTVTEWVYGVCAARIR